ncbi:Hypothetical protein PHPALM_257 [Phytophthora palmivora]|uniref:M96 mating-specific protein family n=1 Tax=Phytophthora palmivora TaxID=4796 RepID=A0A2P4YVA4_9STRA|nr:Hypothetical protein PHPALM_257 [Phytophthora palmivora]
MTFLDDIWSPFTEWELVSDGNATSKAKTLQKKRRRDRNRPNHEIARLQGEAGELERELHKHLAHASKKARNSFNAHVKNAALKTFLREIVDDTRVLKQNLNNQMDELVRVLSHLINRIPRKLPYETVQYDAVFRRMAGLVDEQYKDMEHILRLADLDGSNSDVADSWISRSNGGNEHLLRSRNSSSTAFQKFCPLWKIVESDESAELPLDLASRIAIQNDEVVVDDHVCTMRMAMKQFIEKDRIVQVWSLLVDWPVVGNMRDVQTQEQGWGYIQPLNESTIVCLDCSLMKPTIRRVHPNGNYDAQLEFLAKLYQNMIISRLQMLEDQTLDQVVQEKRISVAAH